MLYTKLLAIGALLISRTSELYVTTMGEFSDGVVPPAYYNFVIAGITNAQT